MCYDTRRRGLDVLRVGISPDCASRGTRDGGSAPSRPVTLPLPLRNRLAELILESLSDPEARRGLEAVAAVCADPRVCARLADLPERAPRDFFEERNGGLRLKSGWRQHAAEFGERSGRAWQVIDGRPMDPPEPPLGRALDAAALLFDAGLYYEVHELLEPYWIRAAGADREALQGLIQIAVGFQHLANGNVAGARALLADGSTRTLGRELGGLDLQSFARAARACLDEVASRGADAARDFDWTAVPRFPVRCP